MTMDRRKKPLDVTASSVSAGIDDAASSKFFPPPPEKNLGLPCFLTGDPDLASPQTGTLTCFSQTGTWTNFLTYRTLNLAFPLGHASGLGFLPQTRT